MLHVYIHANPFYGPNLKCYIVLSIVLYSASYRQIQIYRIYPLQSLAIPCSYPLQLSLAATPVQPMGWGSRNLMHSLSQATVSHGAFSRLAHLLFFSLFMFTTTQACGWGCIKVEYFGAHVLLWDSALWVSNVTFCFFCPVPVQWAAILYLLLCFGVFVFLCCKSYVAQHIE